MLVVVMEVANAGPADLTACLARLSPLFAVPSTLPLPTTSSSLLALRRPLLLRAQESSRPSFHDFHDSRNTRTQLRTNGTLQFPRSPPRAPLVLVLEHPFCVRVAIPAASNAVPVLELLCTCITTPRRGRLGQPDEWRLGRAPVPRSAPVVPYLCTELR